MDRLTPGQRGMALCPLMQEAHSQWERCWTKVGLRNFSKDLPKQPQSIHNLKGLSLAAVLLDI